jgi:hypothetical protein
MAPSWIGAPETHLRRTPMSTAVTMVEAMRASYNPAQLDVLGRAAELARAGPDADEVPGPWA